MLDFKINTQIYITQKKKTDPWIPWQRVTETKEVLGQPHLDNDNIIPIELPSTHTVTQRKVLKYCY